MERREHHWGGGLRRPYPYVVGDTAKDERELFYGTPEREELTNDIWKMGKHEV